MGSSYRDAVEKSVVDVLEAERCVERRRLVEAVCRGLKELDGASCRSMAYGEISQLAKRGAVYIYGDIVCRGVHIDAGLLEQLATALAPPTLAVQFAILVEASMRGRDTAEMVEGFVDLVKSEVEFYRASGGPVLVGVAYTPRGFADAVAAAALFAYLKERRFPTLPVCLALPRESQLQLMAIPVYLLLTGDLLIEHYWFGYGEGSTYGEVDTVRAALSHLPLKASLPNSCRIREVLNGAEICRTSEFFYRSVVTARRGRQDEALFEVFSGSTLWEAVVNYINKYFESDYGRYFWFTRFLCLKKESREGERRKRRTRF